MMMMMIGISVHRVHITEVKILQLFTKLKIIVMPPIEMMVVGLTLFNSTKQAVGAV